MSAGRLLARENVRKGIAAVIAGLAHVQDCVDAFNRFERLHIDHTAHIENDNRRPVRGCDLFQAVNFHREQIIFTRKRIPVLPFAGIAGNHKDGRSRFIRK